MGRSHRDISSIMPHLTLPSYRIARPIGEGRRGDSERSRLRRSVALEVCSGRADQSNWQPLLPSQVVLRAAPFGTARPAMRPPELPPGPPSVRALPRRVALRAVIQPHAQLLLKIPHLAGIARTATLDEQQLLVLGHGHDGVCVDAADTFRRSVVLTNSSSPATLARVAKSASTSSTTFPASSRRVLTTLSAATFLTRHT